MPAEIAAWLDSISALQLVGWAAGVVAVIAFFWKGWPVLKTIAHGLTHVVEMGDAIAGLPAFIERTDKTLAEQDVKIESIHHETHTNNGSSIKDAQLRTEDAVERIEIGVKGLYDEVRDLRDADAKMAAELEHTRPPRSRFEPKE